MKKLIIILIAGSLVSCSDLVSDLNQDPNNPTTSSYDYILTGSEVANIIFHRGETARRAGIFAGQYTGIDRQHLGYSEYAVTTSDFDAIWDDAFINTLRNAIEAQDAAQAAGITGVTIGITQVLQAMTLGSVASLYGDVPFDQAGRFEFENPAFEDQVTVYGKVQLLLDEAIANLALGTGRPVAGADIYFDGDPTAWTEVAYTLKARFFLHTKEYGNAYTAAQNGISSAANSMLSSHTDAADGANLDYQFFEIQSRQSDLITSDFMASLIDADAMTNPIIANYRGHAKTNETGRYNYLFTTTAFGVQPNTAGYAGITEQGVMVSYQENLLILAEAAARTVDFATGLGHLNDLRAFLTTGGYMTTVDLADVLYDAFVAADFQNGGIENLDNIGQDDALLREILEERYVTLFGQIEPFNDTRRTLGEATVRVPVLPNTGSDLPQRFLYPQSEIDRNSSVPSPLPGFFETTAVNQ